MQIDWFTLVAEVVNFLILVWLLQRFLYEPIVNAMKKREQAIEETLQEADQKRKQAEEEEQKYQALQQELENERDQRLRQAREEADERRVKLLEKAREEANEMREHWELALQQEKNAFLGEIEQRIGTSAVEVARRALADLANKQLEAEVVNVFVQRLQDKQDEIKGAFENGTVRINSAFELNEDYRKAIESALPIDAEYQIDPDLLCGIRLTTGEHQVSWDFASYTQALREQFEVAIQSAANRDGRL